MRGIVYSVPSLTRGIHRTGVSYYHAMFDPGWAHCWEHMHHHEGWKMCVFPVFDTGVLSAVVQDDHGRAVHVGSAPNLVWEPHYSPWVGFLRRADAVVRHGFLPWMEFVEPRETVCHPPAHRLGSW